MKREIITTKDGSKTIHLPELEESYHSIHGAVQEAIHVFIKSGFCESNKSPITILEIGLGTGLNAILTLIEAEKSGRSVHYTGIEAYPISTTEMEQLDYDNLPKIKEHILAYQQIHTSPWEKEVAIHPNFTILKKHIQLADFVSENDVFDLIYFDAFAPQKQPEMWSKAVFKKMKEVLRVGGILVTYSSKGDVRRTLLSVGFDVEKIPGPPGKREMLRAIKI